MPLDTETSVLDECWKRHFLWTLSLLSRSLLLKALAKSPYYSIVTLIDACILPFSMFNLVIDRTQ